MGREFDQIVGGTRPSFSTTSWTVVLAAAGKDEAQARRALETFFEGYWPPLYIFARRCGRGAEDAQDSVQAFFLHVLQTRVLAGANRDLGRFRTYLLRCFRNFLANERKQDLTLKRGGEFHFVPLAELDTSDLEGQAEAKNWAPECAYDVGWAFSLVDRVVRTLHAEAVARDKERWFDELRSFLPGYPHAKPPGAEDEAESYRAAAHRLGLSHEALRTAVHRLRSRFRELLRAEVASTVEAPDEIDAEMRHLRAMLSLAYCGGG